MHSAQEELWDPQPPSRHASPVPHRPPSNSRVAHVTRHSPAKRITFYKSGDSQFGGVRMAVHKRSFKCFDALLDDLSQKVPLPFGVRTVTTPRGTHTIKHLEQLQDGGCYLCSDRRQAKPINMELASRRPGVWYHHSRRPQRPETFSATPPGHLPYRQRRILLVKNSEPGMRRSVVLSRSSTRSLRAFLDEVSEVMQFHVRKLYTAEGRRIDSVQSLITCPGVLVCVGREAFSPMQVNFIRKSSEEKLPGLGSKSPGLGPRTPGNGARSPATHGGRSPPHGAHSRASECSEGQESKKNVNFGLETKKSIIHPRSDSSNRSARFSLSSEKSYGNGLNASSQARPAIMNDDIEKRVLVNKDGSLSVEMRVRFSLRNDESLQWSTQINKAPSLTNDCYPLGQAKDHYLQHGQSESCSDPDYATFDPDYSNPPMQQALEGSHCLCCYQRQEQQYDLWENPAHVRKQPPVPPPHPNGRTMRHTHSSSSSSSCNSRRVVRCRARISNRGEDSCSEQSQLVQEEISVTEQVEHRVEVEQDGDVHVEVCRVSRCCSRSEVASEGGKRPLSRKSVEDGLMEEEERPPSVISCSSHVLQSLKEDQDDAYDDLPPSTSQCSQRNEATSATPQIPLEGKKSRTVSAASSCCCRAATSHSATGAEADRAPSSKSRISRTSCMSNKEVEGAADDENEEVKSCVSGLSDATLKSRMSSVCPNCGGCKRGVESISNSRASQRSHHSPGASPNPASPLSNHENANASSDDDGSDVSALSVQSNRTNLTNRGRVSAVSNVPEGRASSATARASNPELTGTEEPPDGSSVGCRSRESQRDKRSPSAMSARSNLSAKSSKSHKTKCSGTAEDPDILTGEEAEGDDVAERAVSSFSAKSDLSQKAASDCASASKADNSSSEENATHNRARSNLSVKSKASAKSGKSGRPDSVRSNKSTKSNMSAKSSTSHRSTCSHCVKVAEDTSDATGKEEEMEERAASAKSNKSCKSVKASERSEERAASQISARSVKSNGFVEAKCDDIENEAGEKEDEMEEEEEETQQRPETVASARSGAEGRAASALSSKSQIGDNMGDLEKAESRPVSASPAEDAATAEEDRKSSAMSRKSNRTPDVNEGSGDEERVPTALSVKSKSSVRSSTSQKSNSSRKLKSVSPGPNVISIKTPEVFDEEGNEASERAASAQSAKSNVSGLSQKSDINKSTEQAHGQTLTPRGRRTNSKAQAPSPSGLSVRSTTSTKSGRSKCHCGKTSALEKPKEEIRGDVEVEGTEEDNEGKEPEQEGSVMSSATKRSRRQSGGSEPPLSRNSSGSVSLGLPVDQDSGDEDSGKSSFSILIDTESKNRAGTATSDVCKSTRSKSTKSQRSKRIDSNSALSNNPPAVDIPTIETTGDDEDEERGEQRNKRAASAKSSRSHKSSCSCVHLKEQRASASPTAAGNDLETGSVKSVSLANCNNLDAPNSRNSSAMSSVSCKLQNKSRCYLRPESATSAHSKASKQSKGDKTVDGSDGVQSVKSSRPRPSQSSRPGSKAESCAESTQSHSLSAAADGRKEASASVRPCSRHSKASDKVKSEDGRSQRHRKQKEPDEELELTPAFLPNASPSEVVSDWLRSIPANSNLLALGEEPTEDGQEKEVEDEPVEEVAKEEEEESPEAEKEDNEEEVEGEEEEKEAECNAAVEETISDPAPGDAVGTDGGLPKSWESSAAVMKVLLGSSSVGRCRSLPEVSPVYGRRLSTSAKGLLDCLAQLQLIEPVMNPGGDQLKASNRRYEDIMVILQSLWLTEPVDIEAKAVKDVCKDQVTPPRSSSGVGMSSGSGGSGKENGDQGGDEATPKKAESVHVDETVEKVAEEEEEEEANEETGDKEVEAEEIPEPEETDPNITEDPVQSEEQSTIPSSPDKATENPSSSDKSSPNDSSKSPTDNEQEGMEDSSSGTPTTVLRAPVTKRLTQEPDPVWVLHLLKKLEKQFIDHYINAMAEFKVRWDLDDNLILDTMISELKDEVSQRIQTSIEREIKKIKGRAGRGWRSPRPPQGANLSRESTMTEKRRRILKVMKNQSVKTGDSLSDGELTGEFSDQRSEDDYCPCDACVRKKMAARPFKTNPNAVDAPVMMEFDLLKILQLKKSPSPAPTPQSDGDSVVGEEEGRNLEVVQEEEEEDDGKDDIKAQVVLEETIPEEDEEEEQADVGAGEEEGSESEEKNDMEDEEQEEGEESGEEAGGEDEEECHCQCVGNESSKDEEEEGDGETVEGEEAEETGDNVDDEEVTVGEEEEGENVEDEGETGGDETGDTVGETETGEEEETEKEAADEGEATKSGEDEEAADEGETPKSGDDEEEAGEETEEVADEGETTKSGDDEEAADEGETTKSGDDEEAAGEETEEAADEGETPKSGDDEEEAGEETEEAADEGETPKSGDDEEEAGEETEEAADEGETAKSGDDEEEAGEETEKEAADEGETTKSGDDEEAADEGETPKSGDDEEEEGEEECEVCKFKQEEDSGEEETSGKTDEDNDAKNTENEESTPVEECEEGNVSAEAEAEDEDEEEDGEGEKGGETEEPASEEEGASAQGQEVTPVVCVTEGEEADAEDSDTDGKRDTSADESALKGEEEEENEGEGDGGEEDAVEDIAHEEEGEEDRSGDPALLHQLTRTSVESQPGSLEDVDADTPQVNVSEVPKMATVGSRGGAGHRRNRSPARVRRCKHKDTDDQLDN